MIIYSSQLENIEDTTIINITNAIKNYLVKFDIQNKLLVISIQDIICTDNNLIPKIEYHEN